MVYSRLPWYGALTKKTIDGGPNNEENEKRFLGNGPGFNRFDIAVVQVFVCSLPDSVRDL
jgi:hypothetical protein